MSSMVPRRPEINQFHSGKFQDRGKSWEMTRSGTAWYSFGFIVWF